MSLFGAAPVASSGILISHSLPGFREPGGARTESAGELFQAGIYSYTLGSFYASASSFDKCLKKRPDDSLARETSYRLSLSYVGSGQLGKAQKILEGLTRKQTDEPFMNKCLLALGDCFRLGGNCRKASGIYEKVIERGGPLTALALGNQAQCLELDGRQDAAARVRERVALNFPDSVAAAEARLALFRNGRREGVLPASK